MTRRLAAALLTLIALVVLVQIPVTGQAPASASKAAAASWKQPKTSWGDPDIQGIWNNVTATPLERSKELSEKAELTDQEAADFEARGAKRRAEA
jgi:hypothetical protein